MNYFYEKDLMNTKKKKKKKNNNKKQNFPLLISKYDFVCHFSHALYQFSLYLQKGIMFMIIITLIPNNKIFSY